jgi:hypothetical protein
MALYVNNEICQTASNVVRKVAVHLSCSIIKTKLTSTRAVVILDHAQNAECQFNIRPKCY